MKGNDEEEKRAKIDDLVQRQKETEEEIFKLLKDLGYGVDEGDEHVREFRDILDPAGFLVRQADKIEGGGWDEYILKVQRKPPKTYSGGKSSQDAPPACQDGSNCPADSQNQCNHGN